MNDVFFEKIFLNHFIITLRFKKDITFHFYHGSKLYGFLSRVFEWHPTPQDEKKVNDVVIYPCESGRINYNSGDEYHFGITFLKDDFELIEKLKKNLAAIPHSNFPGDLTNETVELIDISEINACPEYSPSQNNIYNLKFLTPLRMERKEADKQKGKRFFDTEYFDVQQFFKLLYKRISDLYKLNFNTFPTDAIPENPAAEIIEKCFIWVDMPNETHTFGGIIGTIKFKAELNDLWKRILHFGQLVHVGQRSAFGFGKYVLIGDGLEPSIVTPVKTFLDLTLEKENLHKAFYHIKSNSDFAGVDGISPEFFELSLKENLENLIKQVQSGEYQSEDLQGVLIPKSQSKIRALAIPAVKDRLLQRAVVQILSDPIDHLLEENSFAFRKGLSRAGAARAINQARKNGYHFVVESDIQSFFDTVNWELLFKKLDVLYGYDPICDIIKKWVQSDVVFKGIKIKRFKGLPQGAVISPLLANLFLDEFDEALQNDFKLIRYADDFVLLCKSKEQAEEALEKVKSSLKNIDLQIAPSKTNIVSFDQGFQYLGYLFVKSIIIEKSAAEEKSFLGESSEINETSLPADSWISTINFEKIKPVKKIFPAEAKPINSKESLEIILDKYPLYISNNSFIHVDSDSIEVITKVDSEEIEVKYPLNDIGSIIILGSNRITMPVVFKLNENAIPIYFCKPNGELKLEINVSNNNFDLWLKQASLSKDDDFVLSFASKVVQAKINNQKVIARRILEEENTAEGFNSFISKAHKANSLSSLRGIEGSSAVLFFDILNKSLPAEWKFDKRTKNPPQDPVNTMLSFGYSILYHHISTALQIEGLNPQIGLFHQSSNRYFPLASDIQEEFRHIIDILVIHLVRKKMVSLGDFVLDRRNLYPCLMSKDFIKKFIRIIEERLNVKFKPQSLSKELSYKQFFHHQARSIKSSIQKERMIYSPLNIR